MYRDVEMAVSQTTEARGRDGSAGKTHYTKTTQVTPHPYIFFASNCYSQ